MADDEDVLQLSMVTVDNELAPLCVGGGLVNCNCLAWVSRIPTACLPVDLNASHAQYACK